MKTCLHIFTHESLGMRLAFTLLYILLEEVWAVKTCCRFHSLHGGRVLAFSYLTRKLGLAVCSWGSLGYNQTDSDVYQQFFCLILSLTHESLGMRLAFTLLYLTLGSVGCENHPWGKFTVHTDRQAVSFCLSIVSCTRKVGGVKAGYVWPGPPRTKTCVNFLLGQHEAVSRCGGIAQWWLCV